MKRRDWIGLGAVALALPLPLLEGCASLNQFSADVSTFGDWPAARRGGSYAFDRMPSQQANAEAQQRLEDAARPALARAGFTPAAPGAEPDLLVQIGARISRSERSPWDDPLWWHGGFGRWGRLGWRGPYWGAAWRVEPVQYEREVALLIRDRASGKPLYEARASSEGSYRGIDGLLQPMFDAAMAEFPAARADVHRVAVPLAPR